MEPVNACTTSPQSVPTRSCVNCYQRKLKCDRQQPCSRCRARELECVYPDNKITRNRTKKANSPSLVEKVARLEKEVIGIKDAQSNAVTVYSVDVESLKHGDALYVMDSAGERKVLSKIGRMKIEDKEDDPLNLHQIRSAAEAVDAKKPTVPFMLPMFSSMAGAQSNSATYAPTTDDFELFFGIYCERVDPIIRILHKPTIRRLIDRLKLRRPYERPSAAKGMPIGALFNPEKWYSQAPDSAYSFPNDICTLEEYALLMAISYSATFSLIADDPRLDEVFDESLAIMRQKVAVATEISMSRLNLATTKSLTAIQAFLLFFTTKILEDNSLDVWHTLWCPVALATRTALAMNINIDGSFLGLTPFETEIRRRVWWHLVMMNIRTSETYSCDLFSADGSEVKLPANIDDADIDPETTKPIKGREGLTEMTASLLRFEAISAVAEATQLTTADETENSRLSFMEKVQRFEQSIQIKYIGPAMADPVNERSRLILALGRIAVLKMCWVWGFSLMRQGGQTPQLSSTASNLSDELFITATKILEQQVLLHCEPTLKNFYWMLRNIKPWDGVSVLLVQMRVRLQKLHPGKPFAQLPQMIKDAWNVTTTALTTTGMWHINQEVIEGLEKVRQQIGEMMGLHMDVSLPAPDLSAQWVAADFESFPLADENMEWDGMDLDAFFPAGEVGGFTDPWPMFIPAKFNFFGNGSF